MNDKTEDQIEKEKLAVESMRNAKANMTAALDRIATLEAALKNAALNIDIISGWLSDKAYPYKSDKSFRDQAREMAVAARKHI